MIRHVVLFRARPEIEDIIAELHDFCMHFAGVIAFVNSENVSIEPAVMQGYTHGCVIDFATSQARDRYVEDEEHKRIGARLVASCPRGIEDVLVFDFAMYHA